MSHDIDSLPTISRLFDFLLCHNPAMICYLATAVRPNVDTMKSLMTDSLRLSQIVLLKKDELACLDSDEIDDPAIIHHTLSKLPQLHIVPTPLPSSPNAAEDESDEDLLTRTDDNTSADDDTSSMTSLGDSSFSIDALDDSMLYDADIWASTSPVRYHQRKRSDSMTPPSSPSLFRSALLPDSPVRAETIAGGVSVEDLLGKTLELYELYPLLGLASINADEIMGPKSCVFTWSLSMSGLLSDGDADRIAVSGEDIVIDEELERIKLEAEEARIRQQRKKASERARQRKARTVGITLAVLGVVGVGLALYMQEAKEGRTGSIREWSTGLLSAAGWH